MNLLIVLIIFNIKIGTQLLDQVELLVLHEDDFNNILRPTMEKQWIERKAALLSLEYFKYLNHDQVNTFLQVCYYILIILLYDIYNFIFRLLPPAN